MDTKAIYDIGTHGDDKERKSVFIKKTNVLRSLRPKGESMGQGESMGHLKVLDQFSMWYQV